jgi:hypothetical protein
MWHKRFLTACVAVAALAAASQAMAGTCEDLKGKKLFARMTQPAGNGAPAYVGFNYFDFSGGVEGGLNYYTWFFDNKAPVGKDGGEVAIRRISKCENDPADRMHARIWGQFAGETGANMGSYYASIYKSADGSYALQNDNSLFTGTTRSGPIRFALTVIAYDGMVMAH